MTTIAVLTQFGEKLEQMERDIHIAEEDLKAMKEKKKELTEVTLPELMHELGVNEIGLSTGGKIINTTFVGAKMKDEPECLAWLEEHNHEAIVKNDFSVKLKMGEDDKAVRDALGQAGVAYTQKMHIHPGTLNKFIKERIAEGDESLPREAFGVYEGNRVVFK